MTIPDRTAVGTEVLALALMTLMVAREDEFAPAARMISRFGLDDCTRLLERLRRIERIAVAREKVIR